MRRFAEMMGGDVSVTSEYGRGSTFVFHVPARVASLESPSTGEVEAIRLVGKSPVLVVDDDPMVLDITSRLLTQEGYTVATAQNGYDGIRLARQLQPQVILLDVMMPHFDGWSVLSALKEDAELARIPVIIQTFSENRSLAFALGASDYLGKPIEKDNLLQMLLRYRPAMDGEQPRVLVIEDEESNRDLLCRLLTGAGWYVIAAENGRVGLQKLDEAKPHLIFLDIMMSEVDGFGFVEGLREQPEWSEVPVVVVTAKDLTTDDVTRLNGNVAAVLQKGRYQDRDVVQLIRRFGTYRKTSKQ